MHPGNLFTGPGRSRIIYRTGGAQQVLPTRSMSLTSVWVAGGALSCTARIRETMPMNVSL